MKAIVLSSKNYENQSTNYGDCILIIHKNEMVVFDCGHEEHAKRVEAIMKKEGIIKAVGVLSHNDSDHFLGFKKLIEDEAIDYIYTICALKYVDEIKEACNDNRITRESVKRHLTEKFDNIAQLSGHIKNIYQDDSHNLIDDKIIPGVKFIGPDFAFAIEVIAKAIKTTVSDSYGDETTMNAASVCLFASSNHKTLLLTGDSIFENFENHLDDLTYIQAPHHGKRSQIEKIKNYYNENCCSNPPKFIISDNTGDSNGGCKDYRLLKGFAYSKTEDGDIVIEFEQESDKKDNVKTLGIDLCKFF